MQPVFDPEKNWPLFASRAVIVAMFVLLMKMRHISWYEWNIRTWICKHDFPWPITKVLVKILRFHRSYKPVLITKRTIESQEHSKIENGCSGPNPFPPPAGGGYDLLLGPPLARRSGYLKKACRLLALHSCIALLGWSAPCRSAQWISCWHILCNRTWDQWIIDPFHTERQFLILPLRGRMLRIGVDDRDHLFRTICCLLCSIVRSRALSGGGGNGVESMSCNDISTFHWCLQELPLSLGRASTNWWQVPRSCFALIFKVHHFFPFKNRFG